MGEQDEKRLFPAYNIAVIQEVNHYIVENVRTARRFIKKVFPEKEKAAGVRSAVFFIGALSFLVSDIVLILNTFGKTSKQSLRILNLSLYYLGQLLTVSA